LKSESNIFLDSFLYLSRYWSEHLDIGVYLEIPLFDNRMSHLANVLGFLLEYKEKQFGIW